jgi:hypothetical protein
VVHVPCERQLIFFVEFGLIVELDVVSGAKRTPIRTNNDINMLEDDLVTCYSIYKVAIEHDYIRHRSGTLKFAKVSDNSFGFECRRIRRCAWTNGALSETARLRHYSSPETC